MIEARRGHRETSHTKLSTAGGYSAYNTLTINWERGYLSLARAAAASAWVTASWVTRKSRAASKLPLPRLRLSGVRSIRVTSHPNMAVASATLGPICPVPRTATFRDVISQG